VQVLVPALAQFIAGNTDVSFTRVEMLNQVDFVCHCPSSRLFLVFVALVKICTIKALREIPFVSAVRFKSSINCAGIRIPLLTIVDGSLSFRRGMLPPFLE
jgi:hypothetical protein